jgi:hypothetical protein
VPLDGILEQKKQRERENGMQQCLMKRGVKEIKKNAVRGIR